MVEHVIAAHPAGSFGCACGLPLDGRAAAARHAARSGLCAACLGSGQAATGQDPTGQGATGDCATCGGSGSSAVRSVTVQARVTEEFVRKTAALLPAEFGLAEVVALLEKHLPRSGGIETVLSVAAGMIRYLEVRGEVVLCSAPDALPAEGVRQHYGDPRWIRTF